MISFRPHLDGYYDVSDQLIHSLRRRAEGQLEAQQTRKEALTTIPEFEAHRAAIRDRYLAAIGGLPVPDGEPRPPLQPEITGKLDRGSYTIEKLLYQSLPGFYVTAALYVPKRLSGPAPAVVFVCGHSEQGKAYPTYQAVCVDLVQNGFVVLAMDPPGQGERYQYWDADGGRRVIGGCTTEHTYAGFQFYLQGASISRHFTWDAIRAVDYLCDRPEVDPGRIGVTGNSGGGTQTVLLMLAEPRLAAAVPCTFVMTLDSYHTTGQAQDAEQLIPGAFLHGPDHDDYLTAMAPKPVLVGAAAWDFFPIEGSLEAVRRAKRIWALYGAEEKVEIAIAPTRHAYSAQLREAAVNWFRRHLAGLPMDFKTGEPQALPEEVLPEEALHVVPGGQVLAAFPQSKSLWHLGRERAASLPALPARTPETLRGELAAVLGVPAHDRSAPIYPRVVHEGVVQGYPVEKVFFFSEPAVCVAGVMLHPRGSAAPVRTELLLLQNGTESLEQEQARVEALLRRNHRVFVFDPRGVGSVESRPFSGAAPHGREWRLGCDAMMMATSTLGLRVFDVLRAFDYLTTCRTDVPAGSVAIHGVDDGAAWAWHAAVLEPRFCALTVENPLASMADLVAAQYYDTRRNSFRSLAYGMLSRFDLADLLPALAPRPVRILQPRDPQGLVLRPDAYRQDVLVRAALPGGWAPEVG